MKVCKKKSRENVGRNEQTVEGKEQVVIKRVHCCNFKDENDIDDEKKQKPKTAIGQNPFDPRLRFYGYW
jgi:hypothetical protein